MSTPTAPTRPVEPGAAGFTPKPPSRWTSGRIVGLTLASGALVGSGLMATAAVGVHLVDEHQREGGYLTTDTEQFSSRGHAVTLDEIDLGGLNGDWLLGTARLRATGADDSAVFVGVAPSDDVDAYLDGVGHSEVDDLDETSYVEHPGGAPAQAPEDLDIWTAQTHGTGTQAVTWKPTEGEWTVVVMNQDGSAGVDVRADVGATAPIVRHAVQGLGAASLLTGLGGGVALFLVLRTERRSSATTR